MNDRPPRVSVVSATCNDADRLGASLESVLEHDFRDLELIVVNDGSSDPRVGETLAAVARRDRRVVRLDIPHGGLTAALTAGCAAARGHYIARLDVGDRYLGGKLAAQAAFLDRHGDVALLSCGTRYVYGDGTVLREVVIDEPPAEATRKLRASRVAELRGISHHGTALFRRADYERVGGYRRQFRLAQDIDLWMRLTDHGMLAFLPTVYYEADLSAESLSGLHAREQRRLGALAIALRAARERGGSESELLNEADTVLPNTSPSGWRARWARSAGHYFLGNLLVRRGHPRGREHLWRAAAAMPLNLRAWALLARDLVRRDTA